MHSTCIEIIETQQAKICNNCRNTRLKLLKTNAAICFNKIMRFINLNCVTNSCNCHTYVTWRGNEYEPPEDDTIVSKRVGA